MIKYHRRTLCASRPAPFGCLPFSELLFVDSSRGVGGSVRMPEVARKAKCNSLCNDFLYVIFNLG